MILFCSTAHQGKCVFCTPFLTVVHHSITKLHYCGQTQWCVYTQSMGNKCSLMHNRGS